MKSITRKISLLLVLSATLFLSSCLDSGQGSYAGNGEYSYITRDEATNLVYARVASNNGVIFITSEKIKTLTPETIAFISYQIDLDDEAQRTLIGTDKNVIVYNATLAGEPIIADQTTTIKFEDVPNDPIVHFENILTPIFAPNEYFGDRWYFPFQVKLKKGEKVKANFYKATNESDTSSDEIIVDIRLTKFDQAEEGETEKTVADYVVVNFSDLRTMLKGSDKEKASLKFRFYRTENEEELYTTQDSYILQLK